MGRATIIIGILYGLAAITFMVVAVFYQGLGLVLLWPAGSFLLLSAGYLYFGPLVYGKSADGRQNILLRLLHLPSYVFNKITWKIGRASKPDDLWNEIVPNVFLGRRLVNRAQLPANTALVVDLTAEYLEADDILTSVDYKCIPSLDGSALVCDNFAQVLDYATDKRAVTYVHCAVGHGRAAMFVACLLIKTGVCANVKEAECLIKAKRPRVHLRPSHKKIIELHCGI